MEKVRLYTVRLNLFDGTGAEGSAQGGEGTGAPADTAKETKTGDLSNVIYGVGDAPAMEQGDAISSAAGEKTGAKATSDTLEAKKKAFRDMINGEYKDVYTDNVQGIIDRRFSQTKQLESKLEKMQPVIDMLAQRYGVDEKDLGALEQAIVNDYAYWEEAAEQAGMTVEQYMKYNQMERKYKRAMEMENTAKQQEQWRQQAQKWMDEAQMLKSKFADFDIEAELADRNFVAMLQSGVPMELAFKGKYFDRFMQDATAYAADKAEKQVVDNIRARGNRPAENGVQVGGAGFITKKDSSNLTLKDFDEIAKRARNGEKIRF